MNILGGMAMIGMAGGSGQRRKVRRRWRSSLLTVALLLAALGHFAPQRSANAQTCVVTGFVLGATLTACSATTSGTGSSVGGNAGLAPFFAAAGVQAAVQRLSGTLGVSGAAGGTTVTVQAFTFFGPATFPVGPNVAVCNGAPTTWPPGPNCVLNPNAQQFTIQVSDTNVTVNTHTQTNTIIVAETPFFGFVFGDFHTSFQTALLDQNWSFVETLFAQFRGFGVNGAGPGAGLGGQFASLGTSDAGGVNIAQLGLDGRPRPSPWFVWVRPHGTLGKVDSSSERLGFRYDTAGVSAGLEYRWPGPWIAGATLGYAHTSITQTTTNDKGQIDSLQVGAYGGYRGERTHVVVAALFQQNWISSERLTVLSPAVATASYSAQAYSVGVEAGRKYPVMQAWVQPLASLVFTHLRQGGFTESGTTLLEIAGGSRSVNALKLSLGARVWRDFDMGWGTLTPEFRARWVQDLLNERRAITARFVGDASQTAFSVNGAKPTPAAALIGGGLTYSAGPGFKLSFAYDAELRANSRSHTIQAQLKLRW